AHELRTPLTALQLRIAHQLRAAESRGDPEETARSKAMVDDVRRFTALVDHIVEALNIRARGVTTARSPCDLCALARDAVARFGARARAVGSTLSLDCAASSIVGRWDEGQLHKVVDVLLDNAIKFGRGAPIAVSARADGRAELVVRDQGIGIADQCLPGIFDPFGRAVPREHFGGLGLGLYTARMIVEAHGGSLTVTSRSGEGATFLVSLPLDGDTLGTRR
ncbi:MAG TPA: HAMP domain-containing sensor histidine kinase, partial [Polyangiaceae bacterium]